ncbi:FecR family protein [Croceitalea rosinachiae]|uniref:FecR domain-containing protein n=1 Tax=Croceitalea rosinachiae TaxID=3075596 RepID=A0ABU3A943_9FLAO|nr:FecR domain-containing protein [Croceitalea sp. F388]MDT0606408.1 FecR domain-containing protein [Croceitalea sp. F388]
MTSIKNIWNKYKKGTATSKEKAELLEALNKNDADFEEVLHANWKKSNSIKVSNKEKNVAWNKLADTIGIRKRSVIRLYQYGAAAGLAALIALSVFLYSATNNIVEVQVTSGEQIKQVLLPDGSKVWVNHGSSISYPKKFESESRNLVLEGNAFFEVEKNPSKPFTVETDGLLVKVLGTSFDISNFKDEPSTVSVKSGKVEVSHIASDSKITLVKGEQSNYDLKLGNLVKTAFDSMSIMAWRNDTLHFENLELGQAIRQIERKYGVRILCSNSELLKTKIRASYKSESLDTVLTDLAFMTDFDFDKNEKNNEITLKPNYMNKN